MDAVSLLRQDLGGITRINLAGIRPLHETTIELGTTIQPTTWDDVGGPGSISPMQVGGNDVIVLSQTQDVHREIAELLKGMRRLAGKKEGDQKPPLREKPKDSYGGQMGGMGGMGSFGGGMPGGMPGSGHFGRTDQGPADMDTRPGTMGQGDLLKGLQDANKQFQGNEVDKFEQMQKRGRGMGGGVGAGGFF